MDTSWQYLGDALAHEPSRVSLCKPRRATLKPDPSHVHSFHACFPFIWPSMPAYISYLTIQRDLRPHTRRHTTPQRTLVVNVKFRKPDTKRLQRSPRTRVLIAKVPRPSSLRLVSKHGFSPLALGPGVATH